MLEEERIAGEAETASAEVRDEKKESFMLSYNWVSDRMDAQYSSISKKMMQKRECKQREARHFIYKTSLHSRGSTRSYIPYCGDHEAELATCG
jgi:hypothetical protein